MSTCLRVTHLKSLLHDLSVRNKEVISSIISLTNTAEFFFVIKICFLIYFSYHGLHHLLYFPPLFMSVELKTTRAHLSRVYSHTHILCDPYIIYSPDLTVSMFSALENVVL